MVEKINNQEVLQYAVNNGILNIDEVRIQMQELKRVQALAKHQFQIWQGKDNQWRTYLPDVKNGRKLIKKSTLKKLEDFLYDYYKEEDNNPTISELFFLWLNNKLEMKEISKGTYDRYLCDFNRFFRSSNIYGKRIKTITEDELETFIRYSIKNFQLTNKSYANLRTLILGMFKYAKKKGLTNISITRFFGDLDLSSKIFVHRKQKKEEQVFSEDEVPKIKEYLENHTHIINLGVLLTFYTGLRAGELSTLKRGDIVQNTIHIQRTEIKYYDEELGVTVRDIKEFPKSDAGDRYVCLIEEACLILNEIIKMNPDGEFLFEEKGKRVTGERFTQYLYKACRKVGIHRRSLHKIRKTYGTTLIDGGVDESNIMDQLGHADISTTKKFYYFSTKNQKTKEKQVTEALTSLS